MAEVAAPAAAPKEDAAQEATAVTLSERKLGDQLNEAQKSLKKLLDVNRKLHSSLAEKKLRGKALTDENAKLRLCLESREVEEKGRRMQLEDIQEALQVEQSTQQHETLQLQKNVMHLQEEITVMNEENVRIGEKHKTEKVKIVEQQSLMKALDRRVKELSRHIEFMAGHLNEAQIEMANAVVRGDSAPGLSDESKAQTSGDHTAALQVATLQDFFNLPGLNLKKLLGDEAHVVTSGARSMSPTRSGTTVSPEIPS